MANPEEKAANNKSDDIIVTNAVTYISQTRRANFLAGEKGRFRGHNSQPSIKKHGNVPLFSVVHIQSVLSALF